jgi:hypothetical protein
MLGLISSSVVTVHLLSVVAVRLFVCFMKLQTQLQPNAMFFLQMFMTYKLTNKLHGEKSVLFYFYFLFLVYLVMPSATQPA